MTSSRSSPFQLAQTLASLSLHSPLVIASRTLQFAQPGALLSATSGFTSFVAHAGGPPINAYAIPLKLSPVVFTGTMAYYFFVINLAKWVPYAWLGLLDARNLGTSLVLLPLAPVGVWLGVRIARRIQPALFYRFIYAGMLLTGLKLVWDALAPTMLHL